MDCSKEYGMLPGDAASCARAASAFAASCTHPIILHISDTETTLYPFAEAILSAVCPALTVHTGDMADEYKAGRLPEHVPGYLRFAPRMLDLMERYSGAVLWVKGNNDVTSIAEGRRKVRVVPNLSRHTYFGVRMEVDHVAIPAAFGVDFALYGHGPTDDLRYPLPDAPEGTVYLNGNYFLTLIEGETRRFLRIPIRPAARVMRLVIVRHGQTCPAEYVNGDYDLPRADPPITPVGVRQARFTAEEILRMRFDGRLICSPFSRTLQTITPIAQALGRPVHLSWEFREIVKHPDQLAGFRGKTLAALRKEFPVIAKDAALPYPWWDSAAEEFEDVCARVELLLDRLIAGGENALLMGHGASTGAAVSILLRRCGLEFNSFMPSPPGGNCALSEFRISNGKLRPIRVYSLSHLPADLVTSNARYALNKPGEGIR